jgi:hypothetical protein
MSGRDDTLQLPVDCSTELNAPIPPLFLLLRCSPGRYLHRRLPASDADDAGMMC